MARDVEQLYDVIQTTSNNVLELVKTTGKLSERIAVVGQSVEYLKARLEEVEEKAKERQKENESHNKKVIGLLSMKMDPERCSHMHSELEDRVRKWTKSYITEGAKGWGRTAIVILKIVTYIAVAFGGSAWGMKSLGIIKILGG